MPLLWTPKRQRLWKPGLGQAEIDWSHPLARGLQFCCLFNTGPHRARDLCGRAILTPDGGSSPVGTTGCLYGIAEKFEPASSNFYLLSGDYPTFTSSERYTVVFCVGRDSSMSGSNAGVYRSDGGSGGFGWWCSTSNFRLWGRHNGNDVVTSSTGPVLAALEPRICAAWWDGSYAGLSIDGKEFNKISAGTSAAWSFNRIAYQSSPSEMWDGFMSHVYVFKRCLAATEIAHLYADPFCFLRPTPRRRIAIIDTSTMASYRLYATGFEPGGQCLAAWGGNYAYSTSNVRTGTYSLRCYPSGTGTGYGGFRRPGADGDWDGFGINTVYARVPQRIVTAPTAEEKVYELRDAVNSTIAYVTLTSGRVLKVYDSTSTLKATGSTDLGTAEYKVLGFKFQIGTAGAFEVQIDGQTEVSGTGNFGTQYIDIAYVGKLSNLNGSGYDIYYDDVAFDSKDFPSIDGKVQLMQPDGNGTYTANWTASAGELYECVDEVPVSTTDYIESSTQDAAYTATYESAASAGISGVVECVRLHVYMKSNKVGGFDLKSRLRTGGADFDSDLWAQNSTWAVRCWMWPGNPSNNRRWTISDLDGIEAGLICADTPGTAYLAGVLLEVEYVPEQGGALQATAGIAAVTADGLNASAAPSSGASATAGLAAVQADGLPATASGVSASATAGMGLVSADVLAASASPSSAAPATAGIASVTADGLSGSAAPASAASATAGIGEVTADGLGATASAGMIQATAGMASVTADGLNATASPSSAAPATAGLAAVTADALGGSAAPASAAGATAGLAEVTADALAATATTGLKATAGIAAVTVDGLGASAAPSSAAQATAGIAEVTVHGLGAATSGDQTAALRASNLSPWGLDLPVVDGTVSETDMAVLSGCYGPAASGAASLRSANLDPWALGFPVLDDSVTAGDRAMLAGAYSEWTYDPPAARVLMPAEEIGIRGSSL